MSRGNKWIPLDKYLSQYFVNIKRPFSEIEAMYSYTLDIDNGKAGSIIGYATQWSWSRNKVRRFLKGIRTVEGHLKDSKKTQKGHPIHFIDKALMGKKDSRRTVEGQQKDSKRPTTTNPNPNPKKKEEIYTSNFESFWKAYPRKIGKGKAFQNYKNIKEPKPSLQTVLDSIEIQNKSDQWQDKQFIPHPATWVSQRRWEDEVEPMNGTTSDRDADKAYFKKMGYEYEDK